MKVKKHKFNRQFIEWAVMCDMIMQEEQSKREQAATIAKKAITKPR